MFRSSPWTVQMRVRSCMRMWLTAWLFCFWRPTPDPNLSSASALAIAAVPNHHTRTRARACLPWYPPACLCSLLQPLDARVEDRSSWLVTKVQRNIFLGVQQPETADNPRSTQGGLVTEATQMNW